MQAKQFWTKAYQRNIGKMVGICCRYVGDRSVAEDLAHEAFLKAIEKSETYHHLGSFEGWLMRINLNTTLEWATSLQTNWLHISLLSRIKVWAPQQYTAQERFTYWMRVNVAKLKS